MLISVFVNAVNYLNSIVTLTRFDSDKNIKTDSLT